MGNIVQQLQYGDVKLFPTERDILINNICDQLNTASGSLPPSTNTNPLTWAEFDESYTQAFTSLAQCLAIVKELNPTICMHIPDRERFAMYLRQLSTDHQTLLNELNNIYNSHKHLVGEITEGDDMLFSFQIQHMYATFHSRIIEILVPMCADVMSMYLPFSEEVHKRFMEEEAKGIQIPTVSDAVNAL